MTDVTINSIIEEIDFLFKDVIKLNVLTYADAFKGQQPEDYINAVIQGAEFAEKILKSLPQTHETDFREGTIKTAEGYKEAWKAFTRSEVIESMIPGKYGGKNFPESVRTAIQEILCSANPSFYQYLMQTHETAGLIERYGSADQKDQFCEKLYRGEWTGTLCFTETHADCDWETIQTKAVKTENGYCIEGEKSMIAAGSHDLCDTIIYLVLARIASEKKDENRLAWFIVPNTLEENGKSGSNNVSVHVCHQTLGLQAASFCTMSFGKEGKSQGQLLCTLKPKSIDLYRTLNGIRQQVALQSASLVGKLYQRTLEFSRTESRFIRGSGDDKAENRSVTLLTHPHIADSIMYMKAISEGIRTAVYSISFFRDASVHGGSEQKQFFSDLADLYSAVLKVYASITGSESIKKSEQVHGNTAYIKNYLSERLQSDHQATTFLGGVNEVVAQELLLHIMDYSEGRLIKNMVKQFESVDVHEVKSEALKEAVAVWQDYIGGIIILCDDMEKTMGSARQNEEIDPRLIHLWASRILRLIGDVITCYHLICQGMEAEKKLDKAGVNFFNLQQEVSRDPSLTRWYDHLITAEYFALNVLSENESNIRIIQRNAPSALEAFLDGD